MQLTVINLKFFKKADANILTNTPINIEQTLNYKKLVVIFRIVRKLIEVY